MNKIDIGIDIGGTKIQMGYLNNGKLEKFFRCQTNQSPDIAMEEIIDGIKGANLPPINKIGIGCPGPLDQEAGMILNPPNLPEWENFPITERLSNEFGVPVLLENDGNAGALGEALHGSGKNYHTVYYHSIGTGFGSGLVINKKVHRGYKGVAAEPWAFNPGMFCNSEYEIINDIVSGKGIAKMAEKALQKRKGSSLSDVEISSYNVICEMENGDELAVEIINKTRWVLAATITFACYILAPDIVVLGGSLCTEPGCLVEPVSKIVRESVIIPQLKEIPIERATLWKDAVIYGALSL